MKRRFVAAGWLSLLRHLGVEKDVFHMDNNRSSLATMIPGDVPAAVAYVSIESAVLLAAIIGCRTIIIDGKYPLACGSGLQLDFRDHPLLGTVAAFTNYGAHEVEVLASKDDIVAASRHCRGLLQIGGVTFNQPVELSSEENRYFGIIPRFPWPNRLIDNVIDPFGHKDESGRRTTVQGIWLLYGDIRKTIQVFPSESLEVHAIATAIICQSLPWEFNKSGLWWSISPLPSCSTHEVKEHTSLVGQRGHFRLGARYFRQSSFYSWFTLSEASLELNDVSGNDPRVDVHQSQDTTIKPVVNSIIIVEGAEEVCRTWLLAPKEFRAMAAKDDSLHKMIVLQLLEVDHWLSKNKRLVAPIARNIFETASALHCISRRVKKLSVVEFPVQSIHLNSLPVSYSSDVNEDMLVRNESYRDIVEAFNRGSLDDWTEGLLYTIASGEPTHIFDHFNPFPWLHKYRGVIRHETEKYQGSKVRKTWTQIYEDKERNFLEKNKIRIATTEERERPAEGIVNAESICLTKEEYEGIKIHLVFRALLFGALLDTGADNSCLLDLDHAKQVVPML